MLRVLTAALALYSYFEIKTNLPLLTARLPTHMQATAPVGVVIGTSLWIFLSLQIFLGALLLAVPYIGRQFPGAVHFGSRCLSDYTPEQRERIAPLLREMTGLLSLPVGLYFASCIYLRIHGALSQGPLLPADWLKQVIRRELASMVALLLGSAAVVYRYLGRFDEVAGKE